MTQTSLIVPEELIQNKIFYIRKIKVMIDRDLAKLYGVKTKVLNQAVKRNIERFPEDFMFQLSPEEFQHWRSQIVTSNKEKMGLRRKPFAFTEHGILMLSSVYALFSLKILKNQKNKMNSDLPAHSKRSGQKIMNIDRCF